MSRVFMICPEPVRRLTAGVGTRFVALAEVLRDAGHEVNLAIPNDPEEAAAAPDGIGLLRAEPDRIGAQAGGHDWVLLHGHLGNHYLAQRDDLPVVVDLYDPFLIENLHYHRELGFEPYRTDHGTWKLQLERGDFFLCSSPEQRFFYLGWLGALGRVNPLNVEADPVLERLISELPFGSPTGHPPAPTPASAALDRVGDDAPVLYFGGIYDWYDPMTVLDALPRILGRHPDAVVLFVDHPHPEATPLAIAEETRSVASERGWLGGVVRFEPWRPYDRRFDLALASTMAVVTHRPGIETDLSLRTRLVDLLWLGLPVVATRGGAMSAVVESVGAGRTVPPTDPDALADAVLGLLDRPDELDRARLAGRSWSADRSWEIVSRPLLEYAERPWRDPHRDRFVSLAPDASTAEEPVMGPVRRVWKRVWGGS